MHTIHRRTRILLELPATILTGKLQSMNRYIPTFSELWGPCDICASFSDSVAAARSSQGSGYIRGIFGISGSSQSLHLRERPGQRRCGVAIKQKWPGTTYSAGCTCFRLGFQQAGNQHGTCRSCSERRCWIFIPIRWSEPLKACQWPGCSRF